MDGDKEFEMLKTKLLGASHSAAPASTTEVK
jgi:hypothetical protein